MKKNGGGSAALRQVRSNSWPLVAESDILSPEYLAAEAMVIGLRRIRGVDRAEFADGTGFDIESLLGQEIMRFVDRGLLQWCGDRLRLTREGLFVSDSIWPHFLRV